MSTKQLDRVCRATPLMPWLIRHDACGTARQTAQKFGWTTLGEAWDQCMDVEWLLWALAETDYSDESVLRLFACRCVRETPLLDGGVVGDLLIDPRSWAAITTAERFARGQASAEELTADQEAAQEAAEAAAWRAAAGDTVEAAAWAAHSAAQAAASEAAWEAWEAAWDAAVEFQADLLRQMVDPFRVDRS